MQVCNELQGAKLIGKDKRRTPGTFEHSLLAGHAAAIAPVGANGEVAYAAAMKPWGLTRRDRAPVMRWTVRFKELFKWREKNADVRGFFDGPRARAAAPRPSGAGAAAPCASTSLQPDVVTQVNRLLNEVQGAKLIDDLKKTDADVRDFFDGPRARADPRPSGAGAAAPCASTSLQPDDVKQANRLLNELQGAKLIGKDKRRTPGTFEHSLLAGHAAAIAPVGANGEVAYAAAMKQRGIEQQHTYAVWSWIVRGANKTETVCLTVAAQTAPPRLLLTHNSTTGTARDGSELVVC